MQRQPVVRAMRNSNKKNANRNEFSFAFKRMFYDALSLSLEGFLQLAAEATLLRVYFSISLEHKKSKREI